MSGLVANYPLTALPMDRRQTAGLTIAFEGFLDNRQELAQTLKVSLPSSDSVLALKAYERWGTGCAVRLLGDFAFAVWDQPASRLFCARDPLGVIPFYYCWDGQRFACASTLRALLEIPQMPRRVNEAMVADYLLFSEFHDPEATFFDGILQLPPAHTLLLEQGARRLTRYWNPAQVLPAACGLLEEPLAHFRDAFRAAVGARLETEQPVGVWLSGGIDSSLVTATAETLRRERKNLPLLHALTMYYEDVYEEEWEAIKRIVLRFGTPVQCLRPKDSAKDEPLYELFVSRSAIPCFHGLFTHPLLFEAARARSCRTLLTGHGGDELIGMSEEGDLADLLRRGRWMELTRSIRRMARAVNGSSRDLLLQLLRDQLPPRLRYRLRRMLRRQVPSWIDADFARRLKLHRRQPPAPLPADCMSRQLSIWALTRPSMVWSLNQLHETASAFGLACRHPFLDRRLIETFLAVPQAIKRKTGARKMFAQRALAEMMPGPPRKRLEGNAVVEAFHHAIADRQREADGIVRALGPSTRPIFRYVRPAAVSFLCGRLMQGDLSVRTPLWKFVSLARWLETYANGAASSL